MATSRELLILTAVLVMTAIQEMLDLLDLELHSPGDVSLMRVALHLGQVIVILAAAFVVIKLFQTKSDEVAAAHGRALEAERAIADSREREEALVRTVERVTAEHDEERRLLAYDLHNGLAQVIVSAKQHLDTCDDLWAGDAAGARTELEKGLDRLGRAVVETRLLLATLRPGSLDSLGLVPALRALLDEMRQRTGWQAELSAELGGDRLPGTVETAVYRIVQEALTNVLKHAKADRVVVGLRRGPGELRVEVIDSGTGLPPTPEQQRLRGLGLAGMQERARLVGGTCRVDGLAPAGTRVLVTIPLRESDDGLG
jgi:two-component system NarL family sensor kinase